MPISTNTFGALPGRPRQRPSREFNRGSAVDQAFGPPQTTEQFLQGALRAPQVPTYDQRADMARSMGMRVNGPDAISYRGHIPVVTPLGQFTPPGPPGGNLPQPLVSALLEDTRNMQGAADRQFLRNQEQINQLGGFVSSIRPDMMGQANASADLLQGMGDFAVGTGLRQEQDLTGMAQDLDARTRGDVQQINSGIDQALGGLQPATADIDAATAGYQQAINDYRDQSAQDISTVTAAIRRQGHNAMKMARAGVRADGTPMTAAEQQAATDEVRWQVQDQIQPAMTQILGKFNDVKASMEGTLASLRMQGAGLKGQFAQQRLQGEGMKQQGAELSARTGGQALEAAARGQQAARDMMTLGANLYETSTQLRNAGLLQAVNLEMQGRLNLASLIQQNPESVVSWFQGLLAMYSVQAAQQGGSGGGGGGSSGARTPAPQQGLQQQPRQSGWTPWQGSGGNPSNMTRGYRSQAPQNVPGRSSTVQGPPAPR